MDTENQPISKEPLDTAVRQQRMKAWMPILHPVWVYVTLLLIAGGFIPIGLNLRSISDGIVEYAIKYDSHENGNWTECGIEKANEGKRCIIEFTINEDMKGPVMVYYEIENFHQNHREYSQSRDDSQLLGATKQSLNAEMTCDPLTKLKNKTDGREIRLNPCGLIANTYFNDVFEVLESQTTSNLTMIEEGIAWQSDLQYKFAQPKGFDSERCEDCNNCECDENWSCKEKYVDKNTGECWRYTYPDDENTQYLYETYPMIPPIEGVTNEHFVVWMRVATFPKFRKLYGYFDGDLKAGEVISFGTLANWEVKSFKGSKSLVLTTTSIYGGKNLQFGNCFLGVGGWCLITGLFFAIKHTFNPRKLAHEKYLKYKVD